MTSHDPAMVHSDDRFAEHQRATTRDREWLLGALVAAMSIHGLAGWGLSQLSRGRSFTAIDVPTEMVEIDVPRPPPVEAPKAEEPMPPAPAIKSPVAHRPAATDTPPPAAAAQAGAVLTKQADPNEPVDLTDGFVTGAAATYAGGATLPNGTSTSAVRGSPAPSGVPGGTGSAPARVAPGPDRSQPPKLEGRAEWKCPFPSEADAQPIDHAVVALRVSVDGARRVTGVGIISDAGHGFGREAHRCAMARRWTPALDHDGAPIPGTVMVNVRFDR